jgi:uncharacterized protein YbaP (TraB family)
MLLQQRQMVENRDGRCYVNNLMPKVIRDARLHGELAVTRDQVKEMLDRVLTWPSEAQEEAVASLATIEEQVAALQTLSPDDRDALARSAEDVRLGRFATEEQVKAVFDRYRRA